MTDHTLVKSREAAKADSSKKQFLLIAKDFGQVLDCTWIDPWLGVFTCTLTPESAIYVGDIKDPEPIAVIK